MLVGTTEHEGPANVRRAAQDCLGAELPSVLPVFDHLDYLLCGQAFCARGVAYAGGITRNGVSVTGTGDTLAQALISVAGETAEAALAARLDGDVARGHAGYGAAQSMKAASDHAIHEVLERHFVRRWWAGGAGHLLGQNHPAYGVVNARMGQRTTRATLLIHVADLSIAQVVVAVSFAQNGRDFCFGAACRPDLVQACLSAGMELVQAEVGLDIARYKRDTFDAQHLSVHNVNDLRLAQDIDLPGFLASGLVFSDKSNKPVPCEGTDALAGIDTIELGTFETVFNVAAAVRAKSCGLAVAPGPSPPFSHLNLY